MDDNLVARSLQGLATHIDKQTPDDSLFILMVVPKGEPKGRSQYVSNAERPSVIKLLREFANALDDGLVSDDRPLN